MALVISAQAGVTMSLILCDLQNEYQHSLSGSYLPYPPSFQRLRAAVAENMAAI